MADVIPSLTNPAKHFLSDKVSHFTESVIREMTRQAALYGAVNLAQGFPDFPAPAEIKQAARSAIDGDVNQYAITWGAKNLRNAIARQMGAWQGIAVDPEKEITVCCGSTEAMISTLLAVCNAGDEVVIFEPFYENYGPDAVLSGARPRFVKLRPPTSAFGEWTFDEKELRAAFDKNTKAIILNTPNNPTGKVFTRAELELIRDLCIEFDVLAITDEIYEHILYDGTEHISMASLGGDARAYGNDQRNVEDLQCDGMAGGMGGCAGEDHERDPQGARFFDGGSAGAIARGGSGGVEFTAGILCEAGGGIPRAA
jgi:aspartate/methionine/tyrosine aminotransferase